MRHFRDTAEPAQQKHESLLDVFGDLLADDDFQREVEEEIKRAKGEVEEEEGEEGE